MKSIHNPEPYKVIVVGAGQAGLSAGYFLSKLGVRFLIVDSSERIGDQWRKRWNTLRLFTPAKFDGLAGMPFPSDPNYFPSKNEMADYLEKYAEHFNLPVRTGLKIDSLSRRENLYYLTAGNEKLAAEHVVVAMSNYQNPKLPAYARDVDPGIVQIHSFDYRDPSQLQSGDVLVVGAGNSGCEIALEASRNNHNVYLSGRDVGHIPFRIESAAAKIILARLVLRILFHKILSTATPIGRKARPAVVSKGGPLIRIRPKEIVQAGIERVPKVTGARDGMPLLEDGRILDIRNIVWSTGFYPSFSWIDIPVFENGEPVQERGVVKNEPGLYFIGLHFLYALSSAMIHGASRDAEFVVRTIAKRISAN